MTRRRWLIALVVVVSVLAEVWNIFRVLPHRPSLIGYFLIGMVPSHGGLLALWAVFGGKARPWRLVGAIAGLSAWLWLMDSIDPNNEQVGIAFLLLLQMGMTSVVLFIARLLGVELIDTLSDRPKEALEPGREWVQFSLGSLFSWTTAVAVLLAVLHYAPLKEALDRFAGVQILVAILGGNMLLVFGSMWLALGTRRPAVRLLVLAFLGVSAVVLLIIFSDGEEGEELIVFCVGEVFCLMSSLWMVQLAGYRLIWRRRVAL